MLDAVLDLMSEDTQAMLGTNQQELTGHWRTTTNPPTHVLATAVEACGRILAIRSYSAKNEGAGRRGHQRTLPNAAVTVPAGR